MNRNDIIAKAAQAMVAAYDPTHASVGDAWHVRATSMYAARFRTGLDAVEDDIRRDERNRITRWLRECADRVEREESDGARQGVATLRQVAHELDSRPIVESGADETAWWDEEARRTVGGYE